MSEITIPFPLTEATRLTRKQLAAALRGHGYIISESSLAHLASVNNGTGPAYDKFANRCMYTWGTALAWAKARAGEPSPSVRRRDELPARATA